MPRRERTGILRPRPPKTPPDRGHSNCFHDKHALGNFRDLLIAIAQDPAMLVWLDGRSNFRAQPQENFARELMELFTMGVGTFAETDVYAGARVFTGWNLARPGAGDAQRYAFVYNGGQHDTAAKTFTFPIYANGSTTIPARAAASGMQDGLDLINAVAAHPGLGHGSHASCTRSSSTKSTHPTNRLIDALPRSTTRAASPSSRWFGACCSRRSSAIRGTTTNAIRGRSSSSPVR